MNKKTEYVAKQPDAKGFVAYTDEENSVWANLYEKQIKIVQNRACDEFLAGINTLEMPRDRIPQIPDLNKKLKETTGWAVEPVAALISFDKFFDLLAHKKFPAATFIRKLQGLKYLPEPDIFHEIFGHCPLLTNPIYADFTESYGKIALKANKEQRQYLARLYWFTVEFGLMQSPKGLRIYGGGILSSMGETPYSLESETPERKNFDIVEILRTPYRIDIYQTVYYILESFDQLYETIHTDLISAIEKAKSLGMLAPTFPPKEAPDQPVC